MMHAMYLHIGDFMRDAGHLSMLECGAYLSLLRVYYSSESAIPSDSKQYYKLTLCKTPQDRKAVDSILNEFFSLQSDGYHQKRCDIEIAKFKEKSSKARDSAAARWDKEKDANAMRTHSDGNAMAMQAVSRKPLTPIVPLSGTPDVVQFERFWAIYPRKVKRSDALKAWAKLKLFNGDFERILGAVQSAIASADWTKDRGKFIPHPTTWLNGRRWEDEQPTAQKRELAI